MPYTARLLALALVFLAAACDSPRARAEEADRIAELMGLRPGMRVADVGAGDGEWSEALARRVGEAGHVYAQEIDDGELRKIRKRIKRSELGNVSVVEGTEVDAMLPEACCDAILLRYVYHHMAQPEEMLDSLRRALRSGGLLLVIERGEQGGHGLRMDPLIADLTGGGFRVVSRHPQWRDDDDLYAVVFAADPAAAP